MRDYSRIPRELTILVQWVCWKHEIVDDKPTKVPYNARTGGKAMHNERSTWSSFEECVEAANAGRFDGIGFVFTKNDPYCGIDLDRKFDTSPDIIETQNRIFDTFRSYSEISVSGSGCHIIVKAALPHGRKRLSVEIYSSERYFTFTGNPIPGREGWDIVDYQVMAHTLWEEMGPKSNADYYDGWAIPEKFNEQVIEDMRNGGNGDLFELLWSGDWSSRYPSQSEADMALFNIIAYYTENRTQIVQLFRSSQLGQRDKAQRDAYMNYCLNKAFDLKLPPIDISGLIAEMQAATEAAKASAAEQPIYQPPETAPSVGTPRTYHGYDLDTWRNKEPPFLIEGIAKFIMAQSTRPVREIALAGAIGFLSGLCGRAYQTSGTGLNLYIMVLAETGRGKEAIASGLNTLCRAIDDKGNLPAIYDFIGPGDMASGAGLYRNLSEAMPPSYLTISGEIGMRLQNMTSKNANAAEVDLVKNLLEVFMKSKAGAFIKPKVHADKKNNIGLIMQPNFAWLGESTPSQFYKSLDEDHIRSGLIPRFLIIEYTGPRVPHNDDHEKAWPPQPLLQAMRGLADTSIMANQSGQHIFVSPNYDAALMLDAINKFADQRINDETGNPLAELWNRHHLKTYRLAGLLAIAENYHNPIINLSMVEWAHSLVLTDVVRTYQKFEEGTTGNVDDVSTYDTEQMALVKKVIVKIMDGKLKPLAQDNAYLANAMITKSMIHRNIHTHSAFRKDKQGVIRAEQKILDEMVKLGWLAKVGTRQLTEMKLNTTEVFMVLNQVEIRSV